MRYGIERLIKLSSYNPLKMRLRSLLKIVAIPLLAISIFCSLAISQESPEQQKRPRKVLRSEIGQPDDVVRVDTDLVSVDIVVRDGQGRPIRNLRKEDFKLYSDGIEQPISFFQVESRDGQPRPLALVFALDISGSMTSEEIERLRLALHSFSAKLSDHPVIFSVMAFGMRVKVLQKFTTDREKLSRAFDRIAREPNGLSTHTFDAVDDAIRQLVRHTPRIHDRRLMKRAVLVVTDGFPVGDTVSPRTVIERANAADTSVYVVTLPSYSRMMASTASALPTPLDVSGLAELTGGKSVYADERNYAALFNALAEEVTSAYVMAFYPSEEKRQDGKYHEIKVEGPRGLSLQQSRPGYQAAKP